MTVQNLVELVKDLFPQAGETWILKEIDIAQKQFVRSARNLTKKAYLEGVTTIPQADRYNELILKDQAGTGKYYKVQIYDDQISIIETTI